MFFSRWQGVPDLNKSSHPSKLIAVISSLNQKIRNSGGLAYGFKLLANKFIRRLNIRIKFLDGSSYSYSMNSPFVRYSKFSPWRGSPSFSYSHDNNFRLNRSVTKFNRVLCNIYSGHLFVLLENRWFYVPESDFRHPMQSLWSHPRPARQVKYLEIEQPVLNLPSRSGNYYHFLIEDLPDLIIESKTSGITEVVIPRNLPAFARDSLLLLGFKTVEVDFRFVLTNQLFKRSKTPTGFLPESKDILLLKEKLSKRRRPKENLKLFVSRHTSDGFEEQLKQQYLKRGFTIVESHKLTFEEQISYFECASSIAGLHGAGLANMVFAREGCIVEEIGSRHTKHEAWLRVSNGWCYEPLAKACLHEYRYVEIQDILN